MITIIIVMRNALSNAVQCIEHHNMFMLVSATPCLPCPSVLTLLQEPQHDFTQQDDFEEDKFDCLLIIAHVVETGVKKNISMVGLWILFIRQVNKDKI